MGTLSKFLAAWGEGNYKRTGNVCRGSCPFRMGSDGNTFVLRIQDEEHAVWYDHKDCEGGSLYQGCERLNIEIDRAHSSNNGTATSLQPYRNMADYADKNLDIPVDVLLKWGWSETMHYERERGKEAPALTYATKGGKRYRFIDGLKPKYVSEKGFKPCWYGLDFAKDMLKDTDFPLVICNGEPSTIVAQYYGIPAVCAPGGERQLNETLLKQLYAALESVNVTTVWIVFDCDETGRKASGLLQQQLNALGLDAHVLNIRLHEHGDLADLCRLYGVETFQHLSTLVPTPAPDMDAPSSKSMAELAIANIHSAPTSENLVFPMRAFHRLGGMCRIIAAGEVVIISGISGGGKTSFMECLTEPLIEKGQYGLWDGKEWSPAKMHARRIQRLTGITTEQQKLHNHWKQERVQGIAESACEGVRFTPEQEAAYIEASQAIARYKGAMEYMPQMPYLEDTLARMSERLAYYRKRKVSIPLVVFDYAQLWKMRTVSNAPSNLFEYALDTVKDWTLTNSIISFVLSQSNKDETDKIKVADSDYLLDSSSSQYIRDDKCNLMITLNPQYEEDRNHMHNGRPQLRKRDYVVANVVKNSDGKEGFIRLQTWWERLMILDKVKPATKVDLKD